MLLRVDAAAPDATRQARVTMAMPVSRKTDRWRTMHRGRPHLERCFLVRSNLLVRHRVPEESKHDKSIILDREQRSRLPACGRSPVSALTAEALAYLRREAESNALTAQMIRHVSQYLYRLEDGDIQPFDEPAN